MTLQKTEFDALMVDWLYGELSSADQERFESYLQAHPEACAEASALKETREAFREMDEAEPPDSLSAILLHEASKAAPAAPGEGLWSRVVAWMQPAFSHPALGAVATLVLIAGVAGAIYSRKGDVTTHPSQGSEAARPVTASNLEAGRELAPAAPAAVKQQVLADEGAGDSYGSYGVDIAEPLAEEAMDREDRGQEGRARSARAESKKMDTSKNTDTRSAAKRAKAKEQNFASAPPGMIGNVVSGADPIMVADKAESAGGLSKAPAQSAVQAKPTTWQESQRSELLQAAKSKKCQEAGRIANDILDRDEKFYKSEVAPNEALSDCRYYIANESKRRAAARKRVEKKANSAPSKALAAPQEDMERDSAEPAL